MVESKIARVAHIDLLKSVVINAALRFHDVLTKRRYIRRTFIDEIDDASDAFHAAVREFIGACELHAEVCKAEEKWSAPNGKDELGQGQTKAD